MNIDRWVHLPCLFNVDPPLGVRPALAPRHIDELEDLVVLLHLARPGSIYTLFISRISRDLFDINFFRCFRFWHRCLVMGETRCRT